MNGPAGSGKTCCAKGLLSDKSCEIAQSSAGTWQLEATLKGLYLFTICSGWGVFDWVEQLDSSLNAARQAMLSTCRWLVVDQLPILNCIVFETIV